MLSNQNFRSLQLQTERPAQREFLDFVDAELRKIETFYVDKQYEIFTRMREIELHLDELQTRRPARVSYEGKSMATECGDRSGDKCRKRASRTA